MASAYYKIDDVSTGGFSLQKTRESTIAIGATAGSFLYSGDNMGIGDNYGLQNLAVFAAPASRSTQIIQDGETSLGMINGIKTTSTLTFTPVSYTPPSSTETGPAQVWY